MIRILTVEDEVIIRAALKRLLENNGYAVNEAGSVNEACEKFNLDEFDLVISDLRLPGKPGTDLITLAGAVPVLIMTSYASMRSAVNSMKMGAVDYIAKPFNHEEMLESVKRITKQSSINRQEVQASSGEKAISLPGVLGRCPAMKKVYSHVQK